MRVSEEITMSNIWWNRGLRGYFFRTEAEETLVEFYDRCALDGEAFLRVMDDKTEDMTLEDVEELFYNCTIDELIIEFGMREYFVEEG